MSTEREATQDGEDRFTVTEAHLKLARRMYVRWDGSIEYGAPAVDPKRPYGNSDVEGDMRHILGLDEDAETEGALRELHEQMTTVLQIALRTGQFGAGEYVTDPYRRNWRPAPTEEEEQ